MGRKSLFSLFARRNWNNTWENYKESKTKEIEKEGQSEEVKAAIDLSKEEKKD